MRDFALGWLLVVGLVLCLGAGAARAQGSKPAPLKVVVTIAPLKGLVEPLLPEGSTVTVLMRPGKSEHGYEFTPVDIAAVAKADLVIYVGLGLEGKVEAAANKGGGLTRCFADVVGIKAGEDQDHGGHDDHSDPDDHGHGYVDPHLWLDPVLVSKLISPLEEAVLAAEQRRMGDLCKEPLPEWWKDEVRRVEGATNDLKGRVDAVDKEWKARLAPLKGRSVVTHHNAFSRPAERYGFKVAAVIREFETSEPSPGDIAKVVEAIRKEHVKTIFVEPQFNAIAAERIAARAGVKVGHLDPLGDGDWFKMMKSNLDALVDGLSDRQDGEKPAAGPGSAGGK